ncbi:MAG: polyprenyl synthetase family protein [Elusimicrobia bacterium]|nr:polyprenyl synthetase family protein [Elusimicrobiota bacterium]
MTILADFIKRYAPIVERELDRLLRPRAEEPAALREAMRYSALAGGKRLRPVLVFAAAEACGCPPSRVARAAAALEMIHAYSLIHDDLPAMDDDDLRRGKPTNHKVFGEAMAILAGDGLLTFAFEVLAGNAASVGLDAKSACGLIRSVSAAAGTRGMVGGQAADIEAEGLLSKRSGRRELAARLRYIHLHKTGSLITASLEAGAILAKASPGRRAALRSYGRALGLAFQIADDVLDVAGDKKKLGKKGSDRDNDKLTYASLYGLEAARKEARRLVAGAHRHLRLFGARAAVLHGLADYVIERDH